LNVYDIESAVRDMGASHVTVGNGKVLCSCLLAPWTHATGSDSSPSMAIFPEGRHGDPIYTCLGCHEKGSFRDLLCFMWMRTGRSTLHWIDQIDDEADPVAKPEFSKARKMLASLDFDGAQQRQLAKQVNRATGREGKWFDYLAIAKADGVVVIPEERYAEHSRSVPRYALERGLTMETCREWDLGHDKAMRRLLFPMRNRKGEIVAISGRRYACSKCGDEGVNKVSGGRDLCGGCGRGLSPKYLHSEGFKRNLFLYGEHMRAPGTTVYVVEGNLDAPLMWQAGYRSSVAMLGSSPGETQVEKLVAWWDKIVVVGDGDQAGADMGAKITKMVAGRVPVRVVKLPDGEDPGSMVVNRLDELRSIVGEHR
jgi:hypothetical protein